jgi:hypothetical protein
MSGVPGKLLEVRELFMEHTRLRAVSLGIVGDTRHDDGYHLGRSRIFAAGGKGKNDYSIQTARDRDSLTNQASAIDIGQFGRLRRMSKWLVAQARADAPDTRDIREIIYSPDGKTVLRWDRERGVKSRPKPGEADDTHLTHTHVSFYRDSLKRDKVAVFRRWFETPQGKAPAKAGGSPAKSAVAPAGPVKQGAAPAAGATVAANGVVSSFAVPTAPSICTVAKGTRLFRASNLRKVAFIIDPGRDMPYLGEPFAGVAIVHRTDEQGRPTGRAFFARKGDLKNIRPAP